MLQPATLLKLTLLYGCFSRFLNCTNGTKSCNAPQMSTRFKFQENQRKGNQTMILQSVFSKAVYQNWSQFKIFWVFILKIEFFPNLLKTITAWRKNLKLGWKIKSLIEHFWRICFSFENSYLTAYLWQDHCTKKEVFH